VEQRDHLGKIMLFDDMIRLSHRITFHQERREVGRDDTEQGDADEHEER